MRTRNSIYEHKLNFRNRSYSRKFDFLFLIILISILFAACTTEPVQPIETITPEPPTATVTPQLTSTPTLTPTATLYPTVTPTATSTSFPMEFSLGAAVYRIPPTIRYLTGESVMIFFELDQPLEGSVFLIDPAGQVAVQQAWDSAETRHLLTFDGLTAGVQYRVLPLLSADGIWTQPTFRGEIWPLRCTTLADESPLRVGVNSDASFGDAVTQQFVAAMASADLDFVVHLGDVVDVLEWGVDPYQSYAEKYYAPFAPLLQQLPVYTIPGNHDYDADIRYNDEPFYFTAFPVAPQMADRQFYALEYDDVRFLFLDAMTLWGMPGRDAQDAWLTEQLADTETTTIILSHIAPFSSSSVHPEDSLPFQNLWVPLFESAHVPLVMSGHFHHYERLNVNGITYIVTGGGSAVTYALGQYLPESQFVKRTSEYLILEFREGEIHLRAIDVDGTVIDEVVIGE